MAMKKTILTFLVLCFFRVGLNAAPILVEENGTSSILITLTPTEWTIDKRSIEHQSYVDISFPDGETITMPGEPRVPGYSINVGIPPESDPVIQLVEVVPGRLVSGKLIPTPTYLPDYEFIQDSKIYEQNESFPGDFIVNKRIGSIRGQRVVFFQLFSARFTPLTGKIQLYDKIVVRVSFSAKNVIPKTLPVIKKSDEESIYSGSIINYKQAKTWRMDVKRETLRKTSHSTSATFYKIYVRTEGIYKITGNFLAKNGIDISSINPSRLRVYNNGGRELSRELYADRPDSLILNSIYVDDGGDGIFNESYYFLFYGKAVNGWDYIENSNSYSHYINHYVYENVYWLTWDEGLDTKAMNSKSTVLDKQIPATTTFKDFVYLEDEFYNPLSSGIDWFGKIFSRKNSSTIDEQRFTFNLPGAVGADVTDLKIRIIAASAGDHRYEFFLNGTHIGDLSTYNYTFKYLSVNPQTFRASRYNLLKDGLNEVKIRYYAYQASSQSYLDWIELFFTRQLIARDNELQFSSSNEEGSYRYEISNIQTDDIFIFDITDFSNVQLIENYEYENEKVTFVDQVTNNFPQKYFITASENFLEPLRIEKDISSNLRDQTNGADFIIITYDDFYDQALPLKSLRENCDNLKTEVVKISNVYDEFSWGLFDPVAIRDFVKYAYESWAIPPRYVLLFGSGDYDYRNILDPIDYNYIPPFETTETYVGDNRARDDFYVCVDGKDDFIDLAIGRLPVRNPDHAQNVVRKIINYKNNPLPGDWRNTITFVADDLQGENSFGFETEHTEQAEYLAEKLIPPQFAVDKIYLIEYPPVYTASITGIRKPAAQEDILDAINQGTLIINYIGHGRYDLWAHEVVLDMSTDLQRIDCGRKQAFWVAGTCYFGRFDNPDYESMSEELVLLKDNGAIAVLAAARLVGSGPNADLNKLLYKKLLPTSHHKIRIGDAVSQAKNSRGNLINDQKIILFGDPTMYLGNPKYEAKINNITPDSIKALTRMSVTGEIQKDGLIWNDFNGTVVLEALDSRKNRTQALDELNSLNYILPGNAIFRGKGAVINGEFKIEFIVPKDITYGGKGRIHAYFYDDETRDASGFVDDLAIGGTDKNLFDSEGPDILLKLDGITFNESSFTNQHPMLEIGLIDSLSGINIAGEIGHTISLSIDGEKQNVTELFEYNENSYVEGHVQTRIGPLTEGPHTMSIKAWDNSNNSSSLTTEFNVVSNDKIVLRDVMNYPNPLSRETNFTFWVSQPCAVDIKIFTVAGRLIKKIEEPFAEIGFNYLPWDGLDEDGDALANGVYLYKIKATHSTEGKNLSTEAIQKLMIIR